MAEVFAEPSERLVELAERALREYDSLDAFAQHRRRFIEALFEEVDVIGKRLAVPSNDRPALAFLVATRAIKLALLPVLKKNWRSSLQTDP